MLQKYCDMRRRDFTQAAIRTNAQWPRRYLNLLLEEATRRDMPGSQGSQEQAVTEWLLQMFRADAELSVIQKMLAFQICRPRRTCRTPWKPPGGNPTGLII